MGCRSCQTRESIRKSNVCCLSVFFILVVTHFYDRQVTKMLPGGMQVLGIFVAGPGDSLSDHNSTHLVKSVIADIHRNLGSNDYLCGNNKHENLVLGFNSISQKYAQKKFINITESE